MTTIAYKNGVLACDKQGTDDNFVMKCTKWVEDDDTVYIVTGTLVKGLRFIEYLRGGEGKPPKLGDTVVLEFDKKTGALKVWESKDMALPIECGIYAHGSGYAFAIGAMHAGCTPDEAVKIASKVDAYTGGGVKVFVSEKAARKRRVPKVIKGDTLEDLWDM
jgi:hypothetical protein